MSSYLVMGRGTRFSQAQDEAIRMAADRGVEQGTSSVVLGVPQHVARRAPEGQRRNCLGLSARPAPMAPARPIGRPELFVDAL